MSIMKMGLLWNFPEFKFWKIGGFSMNLMHYLDAHLLIELITMVYV